MLTLIIVLLEAEHCNESRLSKDVYREYLSKSSGVIFSFPISRGWSLLLLRLVRSIRGNEAWASLWRSAGKGLGNGLDAFQKGEEVWLPRKMVFQAGLIPQFLRITGLVSSTTNSRQTVPIKSARWVNTALEKNISQGIWCWGPWSQVSPRESKKKEKKKETKKCEREQWKICWPWLFIMLMI